MEHSHRLNRRTRTFLALTAASLSLWLSAAGQPLVGLHIGSNAQLWTWSWTLSGWLALVAAPLCVTLALTAWSPTQPLRLRLRRAGIRLFASIFALAVVVTVALVGVGWYAVEGLIHPGPKTEDYSLADFGLPVEAVRFPSRDGLMLAGWFVPGTDDATIILAHGYGRSGAEMLPHANYLHRAGFSVLLFDFRDRGESEGNEVTGGLREPLDVEGAVDYLLTRPDVDHGRIGVQGVSLGAASAIMAAAETPEIQAVVAESAFTSLRGVIATNFAYFAGVPEFPFAPVTAFIAERRLGGDVDDVNPAKAIWRISPRPVFLIHDLDDKLIPYDSGRVLYAAAGEPKELWLVPNSDHARGWKWQPVEYERRVLEFWQKTFLTPE